MKYFYQIFIIGVFVISQHSLAQSASLDNIQSITQMVIYPVNLEASKSFYVDQLGFKIDYKFGTGAVEGCQLSRNSASITLLKIQGAPVTEVKNFMIHMSVKSIDQYYQQLQINKIKIVKPIENTDWGTRWFHIMDPSGLTIAFEEKI